MCSSGMNFNFGTGYAPQYFPVLRHQMTSQQLIIPHQQIPQQQQQQQQKKSRFTKEQSEILVVLWVENFNELQSSRCNQIWPNIAKEVSKYGHAKTVQQCKVKIRNFKDSYNKCIDHMKNATGGAAVKKCDFFDQLDRVLSDRDVTNLPEFFEVGCVNNESYSSKSPPHQCASGSCQTSELIDDSIYSDDPDDSTDSRSENSNQSIAVVGGKRKHIQDEKLALDDQEAHNSSFEYYEQLKNDVRKSRQNPKKAKPSNAKPKTFQEQLLEMQREQISIFERSERNFQQFQLKMFDKQLEAEAKEKEKDRDFFLKFGQIITGNKDNNK